MPSGDIPAVATTAAAAIRYAAPLRWLEIACWWLGCALLVAYGAAKATAEIGRAQALQAFAAAGAASAPAAADVDTSLWAPGRIADYRQALTTVTEPPLATLAVPAVKLTVPVYVDDSETHLNRGAGLARGAPLPGHGGNLVIAGHRDGFFRALKDVREGELIEVRTRDRLLTYRITALTVVAIDDNRLLADTDDDRITLVTCYPFYHVGPAPKRYLVRGVLQPEAAAGSQSTSPRSTTEQGEHHE